MKVTVEQQLPTDLATLRKFVDEATRLVDADMTAYVTFRDSYLSVCSLTELEDHQ